jgi:hypothetical protein
MTADSMTVTFSDEQWKAIMAELPRASELRAHVKDAYEDAMTWGESALELSTDDVAILRNVGFPWLDEFLDLLPTPST